MECIDACVFSQNLGPILPSFQCHLTAWKQKPGAAAGSGDRALQPSAKMNLAMRGRPELAPGNED